MSNGGPAQVAGGIIEALKGQPLSLALVVMNIGLLGFLYYEGVQAHGERQRETELLYQNRQQMADLLFRCVPVELQHQPQSGQH